MYFKYVIVVIEAYVLDQISYLLKGGRVVHWFKVMIYGVRMLGFKFLLCTLLAEHHLANYITTQ